MQSPSKIAGTDFFKSTSNKEATKEPVHAPVPGSGIPTNKTSPQNSYRFIWSLFPIALLSSFSISGQNSFVFFNHLKICLIKSRINGIGIKFPIIQITIACVIGIFKSVAKSSPPRSSRIGTIETRKTATSGDKKDGIFAANQCTIDSILSFYSKREQMYSHRDFYCFFVYVFMVTKNL